MSWSVNAAAVTVGTSLSTNLRRLDQAANFEAWLEHQPADERALLAPHHRALQDAAAAARAGRWVDAGESMSKLPDGCRVLGAELSSLSALLGSKRYAGIQRVWLLSSATGDGRGSALMIKKVVEDRVGLECTAVQIEQLSHERVDRFRVVGLRNLVSAIANVIREVSAEYLVIDATGGYKAQTALATVVGLAFGVPVVYRYEEFPDFIELPPLPVVVDDSLVPEHLDLFMLQLLPEELLLQRFGASLNESNSNYTQFRVYVDGPTVIDGQNFYEISPLGQLLYERWQSRQKPEAPTLPEADSQRGPDWGDHHKPRGVDAFVTRLMADNPWIKSVSTRPAAGRTHDTGVRFRLAPGSKDVPSIECTYVADNHPAVLVFHTTARSSRELESALRWLQTSGGRST